MSTATAELRSQLTHVVARSAFLLDERRFGEWIDLTAPEFRYRIQAYSPDIRREMTWLDHDRAGMVALIELLPKHHVDGADLLRQVSVGEVLSESATEASSVSSLSIFYTARDIGDSHVDGGSSRLFLVGRYHDRFRFEAGKWWLSDRSVRLQTRQLGVGSHLFP